MTVQLAARSEPIQGTVSDESDAGRSFTGWMQLISALQAAIDKTAEPATGPDQRAGAPTAEEPS